MPIKREAEVGEKKDIQISFQSFGVKIGVRAESNDLVLEIKNELSNINPNGFEIIDDSAVEHLFEIKSKNPSKTKKNKSLEIFKDGELLILLESEENLLAYLQSQIRLTVAEYAESKVFLHAGAVGWKGQAILLPARSFSGKSSLVAELVKKGASYYSDDFAVLDKDGLLHPFHRQISLRGYENKYRQVDFSVESLGGKVGSRPIPIGIVLITKYKEGNKNPEIWKPKILSGGRGIMEILSHTIPIRYNPKFSLEVLNKVSKRAIICKSLRGDSPEFASLLLNFFETHVIK
jgi:hypothetical protein